MSSEIELSIMAANARNIRPLLDQFQAEQGIHVRLRLLTWDTAWSDLIKVALYSDGPDVSEIGTTWLGDLVAMESLRAFSEADSAAIGPASAFLAPAWQGTRVLGQSDVWAIPWMVGARLLYYRRQLLRQAEIDEPAAFQTPERFDQTLRQLSTRGVEIPWTIPTGLTHTTLHNIASWVWGAGGDFVKADGKRTLFNQAPARAGMHAYFALARYLAPPVRQLNGLEPDAQFLGNADTFATMSGPWLFAEANSELAAQLGVALPPGASFIGGSHLVLWKHSKNTQAALQLIRFLTSSAALATYSQRVGLLPARLDALTTAPFASEPHWQIVTQAVKAGRTFPVTRSWGLMEDRLTRELGALWVEVLANPDLDLDAAIAKRMEPLAQRLDLVLGQS